VGRPWPPMQKSKILLIFVCSYSKSRGAGPPAAPVTTGATRLPPWAAAPCALGPKRLCNGPQKRYCRLGPVPVSWYWPTVAKRCLLGRAAGRGGCPAGQSFRKIVCVSPPRPAHEAGPPPVARGKWARKVAHKVTRAWPTCRPPD